MVNWETLDTIESCISNERVRLVLPSGLEWIDRTVAHLEQRALAIGVCEPEKIHRITIPLHEAMTNAIIHGNLEVSSELKEEEGNLFSQAVAQRLTLEQYSSRSVEVVFDVNSHRLQWMITDEGPGFDVAAKLARSESDEISLLASGRGITMMRAFMDDVYYLNGGRTVVMTMQRSAAESACRLDAGDRMRELDELLNRVDNPWGQLASPLPASSANMATDSPAFDGILDPFLESLLQSAEEQCEQRKHARVPYTEELTVRDSSGVCFKAFARDLSRGGVSFLCEASFASRDVEITFASASGPVTVPGRVVRSTRLIPSVNDIGVSFVNSP
ncbi:MAG: ATP-binding protein [Planctomycetota bacterium]|jgi:anti-sigma regulatory factor (Ser/Thr protein kinase)